MFLIGIANDKFSFTSCLLGYGRLYSTVCILYMHVLFPVLVSLYVILQESDRAELDTKLPRKVREECKGQGSRYAGSCLAN